jgi:hypothetical protein
MAVKRYDGSAWQTVAGLGAQGAAATSSSIATWVKTASGGETSLSGNDDNSQALSYTVGQELVFINGTLLKRGSDYTATNGTSITGLTALAANDVATVWTVNAFSVTGAIANTIVDAKGDLLVGTAADTPGRLAVGTNDYVLTADSTTGTGLKWAAPASGGETLISTTTLSGSSVLLDNIPATYNDLKLIVRDYLPASDNYSLRLRFNDDANANRHRTGTDLALGGAFNATSVNISAGNDNAVSESLVWAYIYDYTNTTTWKINDSLSIVTDATTTANFQIWRQWGVYNQTGAISSLRLFPDSGNFTSGTALLYGVK